MPAFAALQQRRARDSRQNHKHGKNFSGAASLGLLSVTPRAPKLLLVLSHFLLQNNFGKKFEVFGVENSILVAEITTWHLWKMLKSGGIVYQVVYHCL